MLLKTFLKQLKMTPTQYADKIGVTHPVIYNALKGEYSPITAQKIFDDSNGAVELIIKPKKKD